MALSPVISIDVDDAAFKKFRAAFDDYEHRLKGMPADWAAVNTRVKELAAVQIALGVGADRAWSNATKAAASYEAAVRRGSAAQKDLGQSTDRASSAMGRLEKHAGGVVKSIYGAVRSITKIMTFGLGGGLLGFGGLMFGLDRLADSVMERQRAARGMGLTVGQYQSFRTHLAPYAGTGVLQGAARAQIDYTKWGYLAALGVNGGAARRENAADLAGQEIMAIHRAWRQNPTLQSAQAQAAMQLGYSPEEVRNIGLASGMSLRRQIAAASRDAGVMGYSARVAREWTTFSIQLHKAGILIGTALINTLTPLTPDLTKLSKAIAGLLTSALGSGTLKRWIDDAASGIGWLADYLQSPGFKKSFKNAVIDVEDFGAAVAHVAEFFTKIFGPSHPGAPGTPTNPQGGRNPPAVSGWGFNPKTGRWEYMRGLDDKPLAMPADSRNFRVARSFFLAQGYSPAATAGILAGIQAESSFNPRANSNGQYGIGQWDKARQALFQKVMGEPIDLSTLQDQLVFMQWELTHTEKATGDKLRKQKNAYRAGWIDSMGYERPKGGEAEARRRAELADKIMQATKSGLSPATASTVPYQPIGGDLGSVLRYLRKSYPAQVSVRIDNNTAAQVHVSANAAAAQ